MNMSDVFSNDDGKMPSFIHNVEDFPHLVIVTLKGPIDRNTLPEMERFIKKTKIDHTAPKKSVLLDLRKVTAVDTAAIAVLLKVLAGLKQKKFRLGLMSVPDTLKDQLEILKLDKIVTVFESHLKAFREIEEWSEEW